MIYDASMFFIISTVTGVLSLVGVAAIASQIAWVLFLIGVMLLAVLSVRERSSPAVRAGSTGT